MREGFGRRVLTLVATSAVAMLSFGFVPAASAGGLGVGTSAQCGFAFDLNVSPGLTFLAPSTGSFDSGGETGKIACYGLAKGELITGVGPMGVKGTGAVPGTDTCGLGFGIGTSTFSLPTASGSKPYSATFVVNYSTGFGYFTGVGTDLSSFSGAIEYSPLTGDCLNSPMTSVRLVGQGTLVGP